MDKKTLEDNLSRVQGHLQYQVAENARLRACLTDIRRYCGDRGDYLGWVARRIDAEGRFR